MHDSVLFRVEFRLVLLCNERENWTKTFFYSVLKLVYNIYYVNRTRYVHFNWFLKSYVYTWEMFVLDWWAICLSIWEWYNLMCWEKTRGIFIRLHICHCRSYTSVDIKGRTFNYWGGYFIFYTIYSRLII